MYWGGAERPALYKRALSEYGFILIRICNLLSSLSLLAWDFFRLIINAYIWFALPHLWIFRFNLLLYFHLFVLDSFDQSVVLPLELLSHCLLLIFDIKQLIIVMVDRFQRGADFLQLSLHVLDFGNVFRTDLNHISIGKLLYILIDQFDLLL